ncbi:MAG TPA: cytochrome P450 [Solirubrobacteraceae bacterium]|jgi:cytochrome P450|nr:cytochrome P450 [Solirubrobacteraceae bacterium]
MAAAPGAAPLLESDRSNSSPDSSVALGPAPESESVQVGLPPGPRAHPFLQTLAWALAPTWVMDHAAPRLGPAFTLTFWPSRMKIVLMSDPQDVKSIFTAPPEIAPSAAGNSPLTPVMGQSSVLVLTGPEHMRQRKLLLPPFHGERMREYEQTIVQATRADLARWPLGEPMRLQERTRAITLEVILRAVFGVEAERMDRLRLAISGLLEPVHPMRLVVMALARPSLERPTGAFGAALDELDAVIYEEIARRREQLDLAERTDILSLLMQARDEQGQAMTDAELRDELVTLLLAGHETTATSVAWAIERLVRHPDALARLVAEIDAGEEERYMTAVVNETLRVRPVVPIVVRMLKQQFEVGGYRLPADTRLAPAIYLTNRSPRVYEAPEEFRPERFLDTAPDTFSWIPFGGGIRRCIGASFAQLEMRAMLRTMLGELTPSLAPERRAFGALRLLGAGARERGGEWNRRRAVTLVPARGARVVWRARS